MSRSPVRGLNFTYNPSSIAKFQVIRLFIGYDFYGFIIRKQLKSWKKTKLP